MVAQPQGFSRPDGSRRVLPAFSSLDVAPTRRPGVVEFATLDELGTWLEVRA